MRDQNFWKLRSVSVCVYVCAVCVCAWACVHDEEVMMDKDASIVCQTNLFAGRQIHI